LSDTWELRAANRYCRYLAGRHYENFSVASFFLPPSLRLHLARIYAFSRTTDDLGDESGSCALPRLAQWRDQVMQCFSDGPPPIHPVLVSLRETVREFDLPAQPFLDLIDANVQDQLISQYESWEDLRQYCTLSAAPVGRMVLGVFRVPGPLAQALSDDVCIGLQLANFAQDVSVDREKGRTYLIQADIRSLGLPGAVESLCRRAEQLLMSGLTLEPMVPGRLRAQLALYRLGGMAIIDAIRRSGYRTDVVRPKVATATKVSLMSRTLIGVARSGHGAVSAAT